MKLNFNLNNQVEMPDLVLGKRNYDKLGSITNVEGLSYDYQLMSANTITFTVHKFLNNRLCNVWEDLKDRRLVWLKEFNEWFEISVKTDETDMLQKTITGTPLCEAELGQINIVETEINSEKDIERDDYVVTKFYNPDDTNGSLLHRVLKKAPNYIIKHVDNSLYDVQRTFSVNGTTIYDFLTGSLSQEIGCLFIFDSTDRSISVYDLETTCNHCGYRAKFTDICPECDSSDLTAGYGYDTSIMVDSENLAESISLEGKSDEVKNYFRVIGGDDVINAALSACNPSGTNYIYVFSDDDKADMSDELSSKLDSYQLLYNSKKTAYIDIMEDLYGVIDRQIYLESGMMPDVTQAETTAAIELAKLTAANLSPVAVTDVSSVSLYSVNNAVTAMAKCVVNSTVYKITLVDDSTSFVSQTWKGKFRVENYSDESDFAENSNYITINVNDYYLAQIQQKIAKTIDRDDIYLVDLFDQNTSLSAFKAELKKYCLNRLTSFETAYQSVIDVMVNAGCGNNTIYSDIYNDLYIPYYNKLCAIGEEIKIRGSELNEVNTQYDTLAKAQKAIHDSLNLQNYLGDALWRELCSFRREDTYENTNYISDGLNNSEIFEKANALLTIAQNEATSASRTQWVLSASMYNLLSMAEFKGLTEKFQGGNWLRVSIDNNIYRLRLVHYTIDFSDVQSINVEFSDVTRTFNGLSDVSSLMSKVQSISTSFSYVAHQAEQGEKSFTEITQIKNDGLNVSLYNISNSTNQEFKIDEHGLLGRKYDDIEDDYDGEQLKIANNMLVFTDDYWNTAKTALGKIQYYHPISKTTVNKYGLLTDTVLAGELIGNDIVGGNIYSANYTTGAGTYINLNNGNFSFAGGKLNYDSANNIINLTGKITFSGIDYTDTSAKSTVKSSLGITSAENNISELTKCLGYTTEISSSHIISPYIGGGYLNISSPSRGSVVIDPLGGTASSNIFGVYNNSGNLVMGVDTDGNGTFKGDVTTGNISATGGIIGCWNLNPTSIYRNYSSFGASGGMYFGTSGLSIGSNFKVYSSGTAVINGSLTSNEDSKAVQISNGSVKLIYDNEQRGQFDAGTYNNLNGIGLVNTCNTGGYVGIGHKKSSDSYVCLDYVIDSSGSSANHNFYGNVYVNGYQSVINNSADHNLRIGYDDSGVYVDVDATRFYLAYK